MPRSPKEPSEKPWRGRLAFIHNLITSSDYWPVGLLDEERQDVATYVSERVRFAGRVVVNEDVGQNGSEDLGGGWRVWKTEERKHRREHGRKKKLIHR
jgi:hypothetical protein